MLPSEKIYRLDLQYIADNALNRALWGKKWCIFQYDKVSVYLSLATIDIHNNKLRLSIDLKTEHGTYKSYGFNPYDVVIPLQRKEQNMTNALRQIVSTIRRRIITYEQDIAKGYVGYQRAKDLDNLRRDEAHKRAIATLDELNITHDGIRDAYIDACLDAAEAYSAASFLENSKYITRPHYYLMLTAYFYPDNHELYKETLKLTHLDKKQRRAQKYREDILEYLQALHNDNVEQYIGEMCMDLPKVY